MTGIQWHRKWAKVHLHILTEQITPVDTDGFEDSTTLVHPAFHWLIFMSSIKHLNLQGFLLAGTESQSVNPTCPPKNSLQVIIDGKWDTFPTSRVDHSHYPKSLSVALSWSSDSGHVFIGCPVLSPILSSFPTPSLVLPRIIYQIN